MIKVIYWSKRPISTVPQLYYGSHFTWSVFPGFLAPVLHKTSFPGNWLPSYIIYLVHWWKICRIDYSNQTYNIDEDFGTYFHIFAAVEFRKYWGNMFIMFIMSNFYLNHIFFYNSNHNQTFIYINWLDVFKSDYYRLGVWKKRFISPVYQRHWLDWCCIDDTWYRIPSCSHGTPVDKTIIHTYL